MGRVLLSFIYFLIVNASSVQSWEVIQSFIDHEVVPDVILTPPSGALSVTFPHEVEVVGGNLLSIEQVAGDPVVVWNADANEYYTLILCDADAPSRVSPDARCYLHWLVTNSPGSELSQGDTVVPRLPSHPEPGTGKHRYVFLVYTQPGYVTFDELPQATFEGRKSFSAEDFARKYGLVGPVAGNFYQTENFEEYILDKQLFM